VVIGFIVGTVEFIAYALASQGWMLYAIMIIGGVGMMGGQALQGILSHQVGEDEQGTLQGALTSLASMMGIFGPIIATTIFSHFTRQDIGLQHPGAPFILGALLNVLALLITVRVLRRAPAHQTEFSRVRSAVVTND
jgi:DHA1 family tetracycline resistance protein-like MFS transporter